MSDDTNKVILERIDSVQGTVNRIDRDMSKDRQDIQELTIRTGKMELQLEELRKSLEKLPGRTQDKVADVVEPLMGQLDDKKIVRVEFKPFWHWWFRREVKK